VFTTFATAFAAAQLLNFVVTIYVDSNLAPAVIPPGVYDGKGMLLFSGFGVNNDTMTISDGATLVDVGVANMTTPSDLTVVCECRTTSAFQVTDGATFVMLGFFLIQMAAGASVPAWIVGQPGVFQQNDVLVQIDAGGLDNSLEPTIPVIYVDAGWTLNIIATSTPFPWLQTGSEIGGAVGSTVEYFRDDTIEPLVSSLFLGTLSDDPVSQVVRAGSSVLGTPAPAGSVPTADGAGNIFWAAVGTAPALGVGGVSAAPIAANVTASSRFFFSLKTPGGTPGFPFASSITPGAPGSFKISSTNAADTSVYEYEVLG
jgi:hypothetical protein